MYRKESTGNYNKTRELCFNEAEFLKDSFDIDVFLREHRGKASLEMMRDDLGSYLKTLRLSMIELINRDYEVFVNLSKDLIGLDSVIHAVQVPLYQLKNEIIEVKQDLDETITSINNCLAERKQISERKRSLIHLTQVITSLDKLKSIIKLDKNDQSKQSDTYNLDIMERAAMEYNQLQFSMFKCKNELVNNLKDDSEQLGKALMNILNKLFLESFHRKQLEDLGRCLRIFAGLDKIKDVEEIVQLKVIQPFLNSIVTEKSLQNGNDKIVYDSIIKFIDTELKILLDLTTSTEKSSPVVKGYNFIINSLWPELQEKLEKNLPTIFLSGNPELFHSRFINCKTLIGDIEYRCGSRLMILKLREHKKYQEFFQKWNLLLYFKVRFLEIAGQVEKGLNEDEILPNSEKSPDGFNLKPSINTMNALKRCWTKEVYLPELAHMFWKLSLQIISRYTFWVNQRINKEIKLFEKRESDMELGRNPPLINMDYLMCLYSDTQKVSIKSKEFLTESAEKIPNKKSVDVDLATVLIESIQSLEICLPKITGLVVKIVVSESVLHLRQMSQIPRDFRRTNRESPTKPCEYVGGVLTLPREFYKSKKELIGEEVLKQWLTLMLNEITIKFYVCVNEVLKNDRKIEESIRKLKKGKDNYSHKNSDDDKIRQQLIIDIQSFYDGMNEIQVDLENVAMLKDLLYLLETLRDRSENK